VQQRGAPSLVPIVVHAGRVAVVAALAWLVHVGHVRYVGRQAPADLSSLSAAQVQRHLPEAAVIGGPSQSVAGGHDLLDASGERVGTMLRTSPSGDTAIGFSGPTDLLVVCDRDLRVAGMEVLSSRDTRDHVQAIERDAAFWQSFRGKSLEELAGLKPNKAHAVAGATLTSLAIAEALVRRLGGTAAVSRFEHAPTAEDLKLIYPDAVRIEADSGNPAVIRVLAADAIPLGWVLRTSPASDRVIGYQGPTDAVVGFDPAGRVCGVAVLASYDNEPYVGYVRDDNAFRGVYSGMPLEQLAGIDPRSTDIEGVSGATMTSQAVAEGIVRTARQHVEQRATQGRKASWASSLATIIGGIEGPQWGALGVIVAGIVTAFTRLRGNWFGRIALPVAVLAYLGFGAGALLSQAQLLGWAQAGVARGAVVLIALTLAALMLPVATRRNVYCSHLCAHGAAQQLIVRFVQPKRNVPAWLKPVLVPLPWILLAVAILTAVRHWPLNLVDLEPFDAYLPAVAGITAIAIFAVSLIASSIVPMAYCRHGCPTGAILDHLRLHRRADRFTWRDGVLLGCLAIAVATYWWEG
jgi:NosR/NirI family nitrous oxide reductase transcriptional regulator